MHWLDPANCWDREPFSSQTRFASTSSIPLTCQSYWWTYKAMIPKVWSLDQQLQYHLRTCWDCKCLASHHNLWWWSLGICSLKVLMCVLKFQNYWNKVHVDSVKKYWTKYRILAKSKILTLIVYIEFTIILFYSYK